MNLRHAFRRMSLKYHPDKNIDTKTTPEYYSMQSAYDV